MWKVLVVSGLLLASLPGWSGEVASKGAAVGKWTMDYDAALVLAKQKKLPLMLNFTGSDWCSWCKLMDRSVFSKTAWQNYAREHLVLVTLDFPRNSGTMPAGYNQRNSRLQQQFAVQGYPTYIILDQDGQTVLGQLGAGRDIGPERFIEQLESLTRFREQELKARESQLSGKALAEYLEVIASLKSAQNELDTWLAARPTRTDENVKIYYTFMNKIQELKTAISQY